MTAESGSQQLAAEELSEINIEDDIEELTPAEVLKIATQTMVHENVAPVLLPHKTEYFDVLVGQIEHLEKNIASEPDKTRISITAHRMELYRIGYIVNTYFRTRLVKIEASPLEVLNEHAERVKQGRDPLMDQRELAFAESLHALNIHHFSNSFLHIIPEGLRAYPVPRRLQNQRKGRVFIEVLKENLEDIAIPDMSEPEVDADVIVSLKKGSRYLVPFQSVEEHLAKNNIILL